MNRKRFQDAISRRLILIFTVMAIGFQFNVSGTALAAGCPNETVRTGASAELPDCRAYELVSPPDTNGRLLEPVNGFALSSPMELFPSELASPSGDSIFYMTYNSPLADAGAATGIYDLYGAARTPSGWVTNRRITQSGAEIGRSVPGGFALDHTYAFVGAEGSTGTTGGESTRSYLSRPDGTFELTGRGPLGTEPYAEGRYISAGGQHVIFSTGHDQALSSNCAYSENCEVLRLEEKAAPTGTGAIYDRPADGLAHVVSLLPPNQTPAAGQDAFYKGTSKDAASLAFTIEGTLYVRVHNGVAAEEKTEEVASGNPAYAGLSEEGRYLFYVAGGEKGTIHRFNTATQIDTAINPTAPAEVVNVSDDGSHVYFIAEAEIGAEGEPGKPNLFSWSSAGIHYVATVQPSDLERTSGELNGQCDAATFCGIPALTRWTSLAVSPQNGSRGPGADSTRSTADGSVLVFESRAELTGYDNVNPAACPSWTTSGPDGVSGTADDEVFNSKGRCPEIYRYEEGRGLACVSCNPLAAPASGGARLQELKLVIPGLVIHNLSADGSRVLFETSEALVARDTGGTNDIYEWKEGEGGEPTLELISSGRSVDYGALLPGLFHAPKPNLLYSVTPEGEDVVFLSQDVLAPGAGEGGTPAIYDARIGGGFAQPAPAVPCAQEGCRPPSASPPQLGSAGSSVLQGPGNPHPRKHKHKRHRRCHRGSGKHRHCRKHSKRHHRARASLAGGSTLPETQDAGSGASPSSTTPSSTKVPESQEPTSSQDPAAAAAGAMPTASTVKTKPFGIESVEATESTSVAGGHPDFRTKIVFNQYLDANGKTRSEGHTEEISVTLPPGLLGNITATPRCDTAHLLAYSDCPVESQVGIVKARVAEGFNRIIDPVYNLVPPHPEREVARLGFTGYLYPVFLDIHVRTDSDYGVTATAQSLPGLLPLLNAETILWGSPTDPIHDPQRLLATEQGCPENACATPEGKREVPRTGFAFMTNPSACQAGEVGFAVKSYQLPSQVFEKSAPLAPITDCQDLPFAPTLEARPTTDVAGAPTGLQTKLVLPQHLGGSERATATMREARVTLPTGMSINPGAADGLAVCSDEQVGFHQEVDARCPDASKLGTATISSPALPRPLAGTLYQRSPGGKGNQFGLWLVSDDLGLHIKIPGQIQPDPETGQVTAVFADLPQVPVEEIDFDIWGGARAPLKNPDSCGTYETTSVLTPWSSDPAATPSDRYRIDRAPGGGICPTSEAAEPNAPGFEAGTVTPIAATYSPFVMKLHREDGSQPFRALEVTLPPGLIGKLAGVGECPSAALEAAERKSGSEEKADASCPVGSLIGTVDVAAGAGPAPLWTQGKAYLSGPYKGAPLSVAIVTPAVAGPFDLGTVVVRSVLAIDPETARVTLKTDPLPTILEGVQLNLRTIFANVDRDRFILNGTSCDPLSFTGNLLSTLGGSAPLSERFQLAECGRLGFKPSLKLRLKGGTKRTVYPALSAVLKARSGDADIGSASVALPHSEFLAQEHIGTICTRKQFAAQKCPKGSVYGKAKVWTPLLDKPLEGPVYLRSSNHPLPDLVAALRGQIEIDLVGRIDSHDGGIRTSFEQVPDAPVSKFVLQMEGGAKGLLVNSTDICQGAHRATVGFEAQNGRRANLKPRLSARCPKTHRHKSQKRK